MAVKHFVVNPENRQVVDKAALAQSRLEEIAIHKEAETAREKANRERLERSEDLKHLPGRVVVKVDTQSKNSHRLTEAITIRRERQYNNFNRRETEPVNCIVISAEYVPTGAEILVGHNALHDTNKIFDYTGLSGAAEATDVRYYSLPEDDCFAWRDGEEMKPMRNFQFGLRVFKPYEGLIAGIEPTLIKNVLYVTTGALAGQVVNTLIAADYQVVYQNHETGREANLIRFRHSDEEEIEKEEVLFINHSLTEEVKSGKLLVGLTVSDAKKITNAD